jgi:hypothetical protein
MVCGVFSLTANDGERSGGRIQLDIETNLSCGWLTSIMYELMQQTALSRPSFTDDDHLEEVV